MDRKTYACYADAGFRRESSSGGLFTVMAEHFIDCHGVVYGVSMSEDCYSANFIRVERKDELCRIRGSKYLEAVVGNTFASVKKDLESGRIVLFSGTGCQVNGLKSYLKNDYGKLICVDVMCHGVPSGALWRKYVDSFETKNGKLQKVNFRCKKESWKEFGIDENDIYTSKNRDIYMQLFLWNYSLRPSCYSCHAKKDKKSDITIADCWGIEYLAPELNDEKGASVAIIRTSNGDAFFHEIQKKVKWKEITYDDAVFYNPADYESVPRPKGRDRFYIDVRNMTMEQLAKEYLEVPLWKKIGRKLKKALKNV